MIIDNKLDYKIMFNACSNEMAFTDFITGKIIDVNESWIRATGYDRQTSIGKTALELQLWADPEDRTKCLAEILKKGKFVGLETKLVMKSVQVPYLISGELVEMEQIKYILWEFQNNSEQTKINDALIKNEETVKLLLSESENSRKILLSILEDEKLAREAFQHSESQFRELWESTIEGIVIHDQGIILQVNNALCQIFGYQREMAIGKSLFDFISNDNESFIREHLASGLKDRFETEVIHKTG